MGEQTRNMFIGAFVIGACAVIVWIILFLKPGVGDGKQTLYVRFSNINRINIGTRVLFAGKPVGEVVAIEEIYDARQKPSVDLLGQIYTYQLVLKVDSKVKVYDTDEITIQTSGLLGEKSIAIIPEKAPKGVTAKQITNQPMYAESVDPLENVLYELSDLASDMQKTFQQATAWLEKHGEEVAGSIRSFGGAMDEVRTATHSLNEQQIVQEVKIAVQNFSDTVCDVQDALAKLDEGEVFDNAGIVMKNFRGASENIDLITSKIASGQGTLGRIVEGDDLYLRVNAVMSKIDTLMNDINHYGILFHLNKSWQRERTQKITALNALDTPMGFRSYFEKEVDQINTAMSRLGMLVEKAQDSKEREAIFGDSKFRKDFAELLRQADELSSNLKLYNQQLTQAMQ
ncbi:MAG: MCE family protein [Verrucomicrobia bacterium]|nr:MCE family protein [Verrucomicrobiota bacterium]